MHHNGCRAGSEEVRDWSQKAKLSSRFVPCRQGGGCEGLVLPPGRMTSTQTASQVWHTGPGTARLARGRSGCERWRSAHSHEFYRLHPGSTRQAAPHSLPTLPSDAEISRHPLSTIARLILGWKNVRKMLIYFTSVASHKYPFILGLAPTCLHNSNYSYNYYNFIQ